MKIKIFLGVVLIVIVSLMAMVLLRVPSSDRVWAEELSKVSRATFHEDDSFTISNVRDFSYTNSEILSKEWIPEVSIQKEDIVRMWFVLEPFSKLGIAGHTLLTFELADGSAYSFSVEARKEEGEDFSVVSGLFREYELAYTWGTERDFLTRRILYLNNPVYMYPITLTSEKVQNFFVALLRKTNELADTPRFYNTLTANCTSILGEIANDAASGSVPYDISWNLPGLSDTFLVRIGYIEGLESGYDLSLYKKEIEALASTEARVFSRELRKMLFE